MAVKELAFEAEARQALLAGVSKLAAAVKSTLGPRGRSAVIDKSWGGPTVTKDGVTVAEEIELRDKTENLGAKLVKEAASKTSDKAGDGTTTSTVLAEALFREGLRRVAAGADANKLVRGMRAGVDAAVEEIAKLSRPVSGKSEIANVAAISANNDVAIGKIMADAFDKVGKDGVITVEEGKGLETYVDVVEGMQFDRGYLSPNFITDPDDMVVELEKAWVLIHEDKIDSLQKLVPLLEKVQGTKRPLLIIAEDITGEALSTLVINKLRGVLNVAAVKAPGYGDRRKAMLQDLAVLTGGEAVMKDLGQELDKVEIDQLGQAKKIRITADHTTIIEGAGSSDAISARVAQIRNEVETTTSDYDREKLQERLAKLSGGVAQLNVGASSEAELKEKKARVEDALHAVKAAVEEGIVPGGGVSFLRAVAALEALAGEHEGDVKTGVDVVVAALKVPLHTIAENAGERGGVVVSKVLAESGSNGFDALKLEYADLLARGIMTPAKVDRTALLNAVSVATLLLTCDCTITDAPKDEEPEGHGGGGMGGMGGGMGGMGGGMPGMGGMGGMGGMM
ncbi:chaperonin GroEL [Phycisphaera mikurensis]|uniref:Chaperonin GroEL n=1 Tax=Phycisphaera mikurensis (strain NBRC 102666 / KCTC 22515 / FYK2301M01) TaxID=1142394 RepID=I0IFV3_PHYMF|nr:chaperonin GroEL [Phycisphaera mikurensis]MBB6440470.1 chaperonin GroEL [Phycisphaera mikurensis]BAM04141.1 60 kDa chaperonin [Phycisphaera mikurensis NBRC 102666]